MKQLHEALSLIRGLHHVAASSLARGMIRRTIGQWTVNPIHANSSSNCCANPAAPSSSPERASQPAAGSPISAVRKEYGHGVSRFITTISWRPRRRGLNTGIDVAVIIRLEVEGQQIGSNREWTPMNSNSEASRMPRSIRVENHLGPRKNPRS
jgi:hypothetical protein